MILTAQQSCFAPPLAYFYKMAQTDIFILADNLQYTSHSLMNRCRLKSKDGPFWLTIPVETKGKGLQNLKDVRIVAGNQWRKNHWKTLCANYKMAPYFEKYDLLLEKGYRQSWRFLVDFNQVFIDLAQQELRIPTPVVRSSTLPKCRSKSNMLSEYLKALNCSRYMCYKNEKAFAKKYLKNDDLISILPAFRQPEYYQQFDGFLPNLSILDLIFNEGNEACKVLLQMIAVECISKR